MRFIADMGISPKTIRFLGGLGHKAIHLHEQGLDRLEDSEILRKARTERRIVLTHDLDFGELVAAGKTRLPSVIVFRLRNMHPSRVNLYLTQIIDKHSVALEQGAIISVSEGSIRVRALPLRTN